MGGEREQKRKKRNTEIIPPIENAFLLKTKPDFERAAVDSLRQMVSIDLSISHFGSSSMVTGFVKCHLKTQYKHKRSTLRS